MNIFIKGLKYIRPCQTYCSRKSIDRILTEQYENIFTIVKQCLNDNIMSVKDVRAQQAFPELQRMIDGLKLKECSQKLNRRADYEYKMVRSIQQLLRQRSDIIICRVDKTRAFYIGNVQTMVAKAEEYMRKTEAYQQITNGRSPLADNVKAVQDVLDYIVRTKGLTDAQRKKLLPNLDKLELAHYHGLPKTHKPGAPLRPIIACIHAPATLSSKLLNDLLAPIYLQAARETTFTNDIDVIRTLEKYKENGYLKSTTKFITGDVDNLYTMIPRQGALETLRKFIMKHSIHNKIGTLSLDHIMRLARVILDTNCFVYNNKYYLQVRGGAMGSAFTQVLANIYMLEWEQDLIQYQKQHHEIYGRYLDDFFMTTNQTMEEINVQLETARNKDINIKIETTISTSVHFLDVTITHENGQLRTSMYHKPTAEPYILPYSSDHLHHIHHNIPYAALVRAARICSHVEDFNAERIRIDMSLLSNDYPPNFITKHFNRFFEMNQATSVFEQLDDRAYQKLHQQLLYKPTRREKQFQTMMQDPIRFPLVLQPKIWDQKVMNVPYIYDRGLIADFPKLFYQWWGKYYRYQGSNVKDVKIRLTLKTNPTLAHFFIHKKPPRALLTWMDP